MLLLCNTHHVGDHAQPVWPVLHLKSGHTKSPFKLVYGGESYMSGYVGLSWEHASAVLSAEMLLRETKS